MLRAFFGHHKCASSWAGVICADACRELGLRHAIVHDAQPLPVSLAAHVQNEAIEFLSYTNADIDHVRRLGPLRAFHVVRDPRDVVVSAYFSHLHSHPTQEWPELLEHRRALGRLSPEEGLLLEMKFRERQMQEMYSWNYQRSDVLELRMEDLVVRPYSQALRIFSFLDLLDERDLTPPRRLRWLLAKALRRVERDTPLRVGWRPRRIPAERLLGVVWEHDFAKKAKGRQQGQEDRKSHYRKGVAGDWRNHFQSRHVAFFKERYGDLLLKLGYERDADWDCDPA
jgi:hypothetical protein